MKFIQFIFITSILSQSLLLAGPVTSFPEHEAGVCLQNTTPGRHQSNSCDGFVYHVTSPSSCPAQGCGLIFDIHGYTMNAQVQDENTGFSTLGPENGFIVVQPSAPEKNWYPQYYDMVYKFMQEAKAKLPIDPDRVHFTGFSQGASMTWYFLCNYSSELASIAPTAYSATELCQKEGGYVPELPIIYQHGWSDSISSFEDARTTISILIMNYGLDMVDQIDTPNVAARFYMSPWGTEVIAVTHGYETYRRAGAGHCMPGPVIKKNLYSCQQKSAYKWGEEVIKFFVKHRRK